MRWWLLLFLSLTFALCTQPSPSPSQPLLETFLNNWKSVIFLAAVTSVLFTVIVFMVGKALQKPDVESWAAVEFGNAIYTVIIVTSVIAVLTFLDSLLAFEVNNSPASPFHCDSADFCTLKVANDYLANLMEQALEVGRESFNVATQAMKAQIKGHTLSCGALVFYVPCLFFYYTQRPNAFMLLDYERAVIEMRAASDLASWLSLQHFFSINVGPIAGALLLGLGIVLRTFPLTRKVGGVMMAVGLGVMYVFPAMYAWNAMALNVAVFGDEILEQPSYCPSACTKPVPIGYKEGSNEPVYTLDEIGCFSPFDQQVQKFLNGEIKKLNGVVSCEWEAKENEKNGKGYCPPMCRVLPYPYYVGWKNELGQVEGCASPEVEKACNALPRQCKVIRKQEVSKGECDSDKCPSYCQTILPLRGDENCNVCADVPHPCRVALRNDDGFPSDGLSWRLRVCVENADYGSHVVACHADMDPEHSCMYVVGEPPSKACVGPMCCVGSGCRFYYEQTLDNESEDHYGLYSGIAYKCGDSWGPTEDCIPGTCFVSDPWNHDECREVSDGRTCADLVMFPSDIIHNYYPWCEGHLTNDTPLYYNISAVCWNTLEWCKVKADGTCDDSFKCTGMGRDLEEPSTRCNGCLEQKQACVFQDHYLMYCDQECALNQFATGGPLTLTPSEFVKVNQRNMVGRQDIVNVASLMLPAYALPLLNLVTTVIFIITVSPYLGGDFYLPGWARVI